MGNSFGEIFRITTFGESHGVAIGGIVEGCPPGLAISAEDIQRDLDRRRPGQSDITSQRSEKDRVQLLSGVFEGRSTGAPIGFTIPNDDTKSADYDHLRDAFRPGHADIAYQRKYGHRDHRGGGRSSARETACRIVGGSIAKQIVPKVSAIAYVSAVGGISIDPSAPINLAEIDHNAVRCPDPATATAMEVLIRETRDKGDSVGGIISCIIRGVPVGLGEPVFDKLHARLGAAMLSINAVKGFEIGSGFAAARMLGSQHNDLFNRDGSTITNHAGGVLGGISNGMDIEFRVAFKPVSTLMRDQPSIDSGGEPITLEGKGRHDPCVVPRAVPIVEAMAMLTIADFYLINKIYQSQP